MELHSLFCVAVPNGHVCIKQLVDSVNVYIDRHGQT